MTIDRNRENDLPDHARRKKQAARIVRILQVHKKLGGDVTPPVESVRKVAAFLAVSERTVWRDIATLKTLYETLGSSLLD